MFITLCGTCIFTAVRAATCVAVKAARVPHGRAAVVRRRGSLTNGDSRDKAACAHGWLACAFVRLCRPKAPLRDLLMTLDRRADTRARLRFARKALRSHSVPPPCRSTMRRGGVALLSIPVSPKTRLTGTLRGLRLGLQARYARAFGGQSQYQHYSGTEPKC